MDKKGVERFSISFPPELLAWFDNYIRSKGYKNRSKALGDLVRDTLTQEEWNLGDKEVIGAVSIVYNHEVRDLSNRLCRAPTCTSTPTTAWRSWSSGGRGRRSSAWANCSSAREAFCTAR